MISYESFSEVYDIFMQDTPYELWFENIKKIWQENNINPKLVLDLCCGTGNMTINLSQNGIEMIGIDSSEQMLLKAKQKAEESNQEILFLNQDMREFELYGTVDSIICLCDSINYVLEKDELLTVFKLVNNYLNPGGLFIFDINSIYKFENLLAENSFCETTETAAYTWENFYDKKERINEFYTNFFILDGKTNQYKRYEEYHYEKGYTIEEIKEIIKKSGLELVQIYDAETLKAPTNETERILFTAKEITKR